MGANTFRTRATGHNAREAFGRAVEKAQWDYGHAGYSGTIAEKSSFTMIPLPEGTDPDEFAEKLIDESDPRIDDKWGPAGCIKVGDHEFLFFGWASS